MSSSSDRIGGAPAQTLEGCWKTESQIRPVGRLVGVQMTGGLFCVLKFFQIFFLFRQGPRTCGQSSIFCHLSSLVLRVRCGRPPEVGWLRPGRVGVLGPKEVVLAGGSLDVFPARAQPTLANQPCLRRRLLGFAPPQGHPCSGSSCPSSAWCAHFGSFQNYIVFPYSISTSTYLGSRPLSCICSHAFAFSFFLLI